MNERMVSKDFIVGIMFLSQTTVGILGNFSLLSFYLVLYYNKHLLKPTHLIIVHLIIANSLIILSDGVPHTMSAFGIKKFLNELGCRLLLYVHRVGRCASIGVTCILSVFQAITISSRNSCWKDLKNKAPKHVGLFISICWLLYMVVNLVFPVYVYTRRNIKNVTRERDFIYCSTAGHDEITGSLYIALLVFPEILCSLLIIWSSGSMVFILHRHKKQVQHVHSTNLPSRMCPETRATRSILVLVSSFVAFYTISSILFGCIALLNIPSLWLMRIGQFISMSFPTFSPLIMSRDSTVPRFCLVLLWSTKS